jgi:hypothetical protein
VHSELKEFKLWVMRAITLFSMVTVLMAIKPFAGELIFNLKLGADAALGNSANIMNLWSRLAVQQSRMEIVSSHSGCRVLA